ncbi:unnamed protein product [Trifolium pratense]|uniref:Uncharacterized protein n=1 Tax=Trifolium pratense TaxID=57577 RepID=A0ACB0LXK4_TRIPR|nr:unnamed protein product [Trifolium pratense]
MQILGLYYHRLLFVILSNIVQKIFAPTLKLRSASGSFVNAYDDYYMEATTFCLLYYQRLSRRLLLPP